jgi:8-oxo-dGTP pyrophosphatase MutT (NUDIX family)
VAGVPSGLDRDDWYDAQLPPVAVRHAATVLVLRDGFEGVEVLMMRRSMSASFLPGAYVFPGGVIDDADSDPRVLARLDGLSDASASAMLGVPQDGSSFWVAAVRECFEESGLLLARPAQMARSREPLTGDVPNLSASRAALLSGVLDFRGVLDQHEVAIDGTALVPWSRWVTPIGGPRRYDTRFFVTMVESTVHPGMDMTTDLSAHEHEMSDLRWFRPQDAMDDPDVMLITPTVSALRLLGRHATARKALRAAQQRLNVQVNPPSGGAP